MPGYRYWRLKGSQSNNVSYLGVANLEMRFTIGGADQATEGQTIYGAQNGTRVATDAFDANETTTFWNVNKSTTDSSLWWVGQDFGTDVEIAEIEIGARDSGSGFYDQTPRSFTFEYSSDGTNWTVALTVEDDPVWTNAETRTWEIEISSNVPPSNTVAPVISGDATVDSTLTVSNGTWDGDPAPTYSYQWFRDGFEIIGETSATYQTTVVDQGANITAVVTATNIENAVSEPSSNSISIPAAAKSTSEEPGSTFVLTSRLESPLGTLEAITFSGRSHENYGGFVAPCDMVLSNTSIRVQRSEGLRQDFEIFIRINNGSEVSVGSELAEFTGEAVYLSHNVEISAGDKVELLFTCANNFNMGINVAFAFETANRTAKPFLIPVFFNGVTASNREGVYGGNSHNYNCAMVAPMVFSITGIGYYCEDGNLADDHVLTLQINDTEIEIGSVPSGVQSYVISGLTVSVTYGDIVRLHARDDTGNGEICRAVLQCETPLGSDFSSNTFPVVFQDTDLRLAQDVCPFVTPVSLIMDACSFAGTDATGSANLWVDGVDQGEIINHAVVSNDMDNNSALEISIPSGSVITPRHNGTGVTGKGGTLGLMFTVPGETPISDVWPGEPNDQFSTPLPPGSLNGASGGPPSNAVSFQPEIGPSIDRRKVSYVGRRISIELPPLTPAEYETFREFFTTNLNNGSLPMTFPDPMTKEDQRFQFVQGKEVYREQSLGDGRIRITFDLIRIN